MILASKSGWLIALKSIRETKSSYMIVYVDNPNKEIRVSKSSKTRKIFESVESAIKWINEDE